MLKLTKSDVIKDWYFIELADGTPFSDKDVAGTGHEMRVIAGAIRTRHDIYFKHCGVKIMGDTVAFRPSKSDRDGLVPYADALALAEELEKISEVIS